MKEHLQKTLDQAKRKLAEQEAAVVATKKLVNQLCAFGGVPPMYAESDFQGGVTAGLGSIRSDTFYGKSASTAVREYLDMRHSSGLGAASHEEIISALKAGGFDYSTLAENELVAQRTVAITMGKNSSIFHKLPNGNWGLLAWYPEAKERKQQKKAATPVPQPDAEPLETPSVQTENP
jgi:hypothetical protein